MTDLDFSFEQPAWVRVLEQLPRGSSLSAVRFLTLMEGEDEETFEEALQQLNDRHILPDLSDLPIPAADGEAPLSHPGGAGRVSDFRGPHGGHDGPGGADGGPGPLSGGTAAEETKAVFTAVLVFRHGGGAGPGLRYEREQRENDFAAAAARIKGTTETGGDRTMKNDDILYALTDIREDFLEEAAPVRRRPLSRWLTAAVAASWSVSPMRSTRAYGCFSLQ